MLYRISKSFDFCYGHRVWSQELDATFSLTSCAACRHLHGHQAKVVVSLESATLQGGMVTDFAHLNWFKQFLDETLDHRFLIDRHDPLFATLLPHFANRENLIIFPEGYCLPDLGLLSGEAREIFELYESFVIVDFVPTSENLAAWLLKIIRERMRPLTSLRVVGVDFFETPKSQSSVFVAS